MATYCGHSNAPAEYALKEERRKRLCVCVKAERLHIEQLFKI